MEILSQSIKSLSKKEIINYKIYTNRIKVNKKRKDIFLFDLLKKTGKQAVTDEEAFTLIYPGSNDRNSYYRLKNRLLTEIENSLVQFYFHMTDATYIYSELSIYKIYAAKNEWALAQHHLNKAEKKALQLQDFTTLNLIYHEYINLSLKQDMVSPELYIHKREENKKKLNALQVLDDAIARISYELKRTQNFSKTKNESLLVLNKAIKKIGAKKELKDNFVFKSKLFTAISHVLLSNKNYRLLESYSIKTYREFLKKSYFSKDNHALKLQMLRYICNALFMNEKHSQALEYIKLFKAAIEEFNKLFYSDNVFFYYNALANNYTSIDPLKAIETLRQAKEIKEISLHKTHLGYVYLNMAGAYFDLKHYKTALKNIINLYQHRVFENLDDAFKLKIHITEIILRIENQQLDYTRDLIKTILKKYKVLFSTIEYKQDSDFLGLLEKLIIKYNFSKKSGAVDLVKTFQSTYYNEQSAGIISYSAWLNEHFNR